MRSNLNWRFEDFRNSGEFFTPCRPKELNHHFPYVLSAYRMLEIDFPW